MCNLFFQIVLIVLFLAAPLYSQSNEWQQLEAGLDLGYFKTSRQTPGGDSTIIILRVDPSIHELVMLSAKTEQTRNLTARQWCSKYSLFAATNAGMFDTDYKTHVGYMKSGTHVNNDKIIEKDYRSAAAFEPIHDSLPPFRIFDLDEISMDTIIANYQSVVQNIRLIKRPGENRWSKKSQMWSEAALGEDSSGRVLFIFSRSPYTMHDFNEILLSLPIDIVCAQHLEGGPEAQLYFIYGNIETDLCGSFETGFFESDGNTVRSPIPNVLGIKKAEVR